MEAPTPTPGLPPALRRAGPGTARQVIGLVAAFGVALFLVIAGLVWFDLTHPEPAPAISGAAQGDVMSTR